MSLFKKHDRFREKHGIPARQGRVGMGDFLAYSGAVAALATGNPAAASAILGVQSQRTTQRHVEDQQQKTRDFNMKMADKARQHDLDFWHMQADYNTPQQQMERMRQAGMNPMLAYDMASTGEMTGRIPQAPVVQGEYSSPAVQEDSILRDYFNVKDQTTEIKHAKERIVTEGLIQAHKRLLNKIEEEHKKQQVYKTQTDYMLSRMIEYDYKRAKRLEKEYGSLLDDHARNKFLGEIASMQIKQLYRDMAEGGIMPSDDPLLRMLIRLAQENNINWQEIDLSGLSVLTLAKINPIIRIISGIAGGSSLARRIREYFNQED